MRSAPGGSSLAARYGAAKGFLSQDAHLAHAYLPRAVAANLLVRRAAFEQVGGFFEGVRAAEDTDFSWRLQRAGWGLEGRPAAAVEHRYRDTVRALRRQWRGYAAGRAWLGRRYDGLPARARAAPGRRARAPTPRPGEHRSAAAGARTAAPDAAPWVAPSAAGYLALDAVLGVEELAGFALSNHPRRSPAPAPTLVVLVADRFPARGDPLVDFAVTLAGARVEASARPDAVAQPAARELRIDYREDDGALQRATALARLLLRHPLRARGCASSPSRRSRTGRDRSRGRPAAPRPRSRPSTRRRRRPHAGRAAGQAVRPPGGAVMRVAVVDPSAYTPPYDHALCAALARAGADVELVTSRFAYGDVAAAEGYAVRELFYARARGAAGSRVRRVTKLLSHVPDMIALRRAAAAVDVVHFQWLAMQWLDGMVLPDRPLVLTAHDLLPREPRLGQTRAQRRLFDRLDAIVVHSDYGRRQLVDGLGISDAKVHVIRHGAFTQLTTRPAAPLDAELAAVTGPVVLFFGLVRPYKGIETLLRAWRGIDGAELWIVGRPMVEMAPLRALAPANVRFVDRFVAEDELPAFFRRADVVVLPYTRTERFDMSGVLATALAFGTPTVLSDIGSFGEVAATGAGRLVAPDDVPALHGALSRADGRSAAADPLQRRRAGGGRRSVFMGHGRARDARAVRVAWGRADGGRGLAAGDLGAHDRRDLGTEQLDRAQHVGVGDGADAHLADVPAVGEQLVLEQDLLGHLLGGAGGDGAAG